MLIIVTASLALGLAVPPRCTAASGDAAAILHRAALATGMTELSGRVVHINFVDITQHDYESDRTYPPYLMQASRIEEWYDPATGADRLTTTESVIGTYNFPGATSLGGRDASFSVRDTTLTPSPDLHASLAATRPLNVWALLNDWVTSPDVHVVQRCEYRGYPRIVLVRRGDAGDERLYIDLKSDYPVAMERDENHYLWGQRRVEYVYATWSRSGPAHLPGGVTRMVDGFAEVTRAVGDIRIVSRDSAPSLALPVVSAPMARTVAAFLDPTNPDTIRVSPTTVILRNRGYAETVTLAHDTVFVFDATQGEQRARLDSIWISKLFPGKHAIAVIVTDLAWPHISGVRYWVANGATIISHRLSGDFLEQVVARRWTATPDELEKRRASARMRFVPVADSLTLGGGALKLFAIDGAASEGALAVYVDRDRFLWASDYIQTLEQPSQYADEVVAAVNRMRLQPSRVAAEHLPLTPWERVV